MKFLNRLILHFSYGDYKQEFLEHKFIRNNMRILILAGFLTFEQLFYGLFVRESGTTIQKIHYFSALIMLFYFFISLYYKCYKFKRIKLRHQMFILSFAIFGVLVAVYRSLITENNIYHLPTIFIAVIYGIAVVIHSNPFESFIIYLIANASLIYFFPIYNPYFSYIGYVEDSIVNCMIAFIIAIINYKNFLKQFINQQIIQKNSLELKNKNKQIEEMNRNLKYMSIRDALTGLFNRRRLNEVLNKVHREALEKEHPFSIILIDIDKFKSINDTYGHKAGDDVLIEIGQILLKTVDNKYIVGRWGGEEFIIICPKTLLQEAIGLSEKLRVLIQSHNFPFESRTTASFGISAYNKNSIEDVINKADEALYHAKNLGRNRIEIKS